MQTIFARRALLPRGWASDVRLAIRADGRIGQVDESAAAGRGDHRVEVLLPALANLHSHTFQRAMAGLAEARGPSGRDSFWTWREIMYRFLDILRPEEIEAVAAFAFMEMQEAGFAAVAEFHYLHHRPGGSPYDDPGELSGRIAAAAAATGIGLTLLPVLYSQGGVDGRALAGGQRRFGNDLGRFAKLLDRAEALLPAADSRLGVAPHSLRAVGPSDLAGAAALRPDAPLHMHIAEQEREIEETTTAFGRRPVEWLLENAQVDRRWCLIHCTHMTPDETTALARSGAVAGLCSVTEANLGDGIFDGERYIAAGGAFGVGSDSNIHITAVGELRQFEYSQRLRERARVVLADAGESVGRALYDRALGGGSQALGRDSGQIAIGKLADLVALSPERAFLEHLDGDTLLDGWMFTAPGNPVSDLWSAGRHRVKAGRHVEHDRIASTYRGALSRIMDRL